MKKIIIVRGLPGSGKTTFAEKIAAESNCILIEADQFFMIGNEYRFDKTKIAQAHNWCLCKAIDNLSNGKSVIIANTFSQLWEMSPYIHIAKLVGAEFVVYTCKGEWLNVHGVPKEVVESMKARWEGYDGEFIMHPVHLPREG